MLRTEENTSRFSRQTFIIDNGQIPRSYDRTCGNRAKQYNIQLLYVPAGLTWRLQPLDVGILGPWKKKAHKKWFQYIVAQKLTSQNFYHKQVKSIVRSWKQMTGSTFLSAFQKCYVNVV